MNFFKNNKKIIAGIAISVLATSGIGYAANNYFANQVSYTKTDGTEITIEQALNELYELKKSNTGSTGVFTEDLQNWINTLGSNDKISTEDIVGNKLLSRLMQNQTSVDYMFSNENIFNAILESPSGMEELGKSKYAGYKAITDSKLRSKVLSSQYVNYFDNQSTSIPTLNSNTNVSSSSDGANDRWICI